MVVVDKSSVARVSHVNKDTKVAMKRANA